jgi:hypothetical protein
MADESGLIRNRLYIVWDAEKASLNKLLPFQWLPVTGSLDVVMRFKKLIKMLLLLLLLILVCIIIIIIIIIIVEQLHLDGRGSIRS